MANQFNSPQTSPSTAWSNRWQDWANAILAIWLFISPWVLNFSANVPAGAAGTPGATGAANAAHPAGPLGNAVWNAWILGIVIFLVSVSALSRMEFWQERINLVLGIWLFVAPWVLGFTGLLAAAWDHWIVGALVFLISLSTIAMAQRRTTLDQAYAGDKPKRPL